MLYILESNGDIKVGISNTQKSLVRRISNLQTGRGQQINVYALYFSYGYQVEQDILKFFDAYRPLLHCPFTEKKKSKKSEWLIGIDMQAILDYIALNDKRWTDNGWTVAEETV